MLTIRPEQLEAFSPLAEAAFARRVVEYLRENHADEPVTLAAGELPVKDVDDATLFRLVRGGIERAGSYGMTWESTITAFVVIMFTVAPNFDEHPLIRRALTDARFEPNERLDAIWDSTTNENWEAARASYDPGAWVSADEKKG
ncbi:MAG: hypothetical protein ABW208_24825 [Pyrinomonadaceae bacterium]